MDAHLETSDEHDISRTREVAAGDLRVWKKAFEFSRRRDIALQLVMVSLERHLVKKSMQLLPLAKL